MPVLDKVLDLVERADAERVVRAEELPPGQRLSRAIWLDGRNAADKLRIARQIDEGLPDSADRRVY